MINTCAFIADAKTESTDTILRAVNRKAQGLCAAVVVAGCLPQRYRRDLQRALPEVDAFIGLDKAAQTGRILKRLISNRKRLFHVTDEARAVLEPSPERPLLVEGPYAYIRLADGCNHRCAFCAIPIIRGRHRSRRPESVLRECEILLERGVRELNLISQDVLNYGKDLGGRPLLPALIRKLDRLGGKFWIRLLYGHPESMDAKILDAMAECSRVCKYLDLPIQHAHPAVLKAMGRKGNPAVLRDLFKQIRRQLSGVTLRTTCLTGFPGETDSHFKALLNLVKSVRFDHLGVFTYSREDGTRAADLPNQVPARTAAMRKRALLAEQRHVIDASAAKLKGRHLEALLQHPASAKQRGAWVARLARQAPEVDGITSVTGVPDSAVPGDFIKVRITGQAGCNIKATALACS